MSSFVRLPNGKQALVGLDWDTNSQGYGSTEARMRAKGAKASGFILRVAITRTLAWSRITPCLRTGASRLPQ